MEARRLPPAGAAVRRGLHAHQAGLEGRQPGRHGRLPGKAQPNFFFFPSIACFCLPMANFSLETLE